eukprot:11147369-Lingulodinium_polyedra.AAC.1
MKQPDNTWHCGLFGVQEHEVARQLENDITVFKGVQLAAEMGGVEVAKDTVLNAVGRLNQRAMEAIAKGHRAYEPTTCDPTQVAGPGNRLS